MVELGLHRVAVVVEDDADIRNLLEAVLTQAGFETFTASDGLEGVDAVRLHNPVVTTLDISLPGIDGFEVARRIRTFSSTYIVMLTARDEEIDTLVGLDAGADDYLTKPFRPRELRARVEAMLRRPRMSGYADVPVGGPAGPGGPAAQAAAQAATHAADPLAATAASAAAGTAAGTAAAGAANPLAATTANSTEAAAAAGPAGAGPAGAGPASTGFPTGSSPGGVSSSPSGLPTAMPTGLPTTDAAVAAATAAALPAEGAYALPGGGADAAGIVTPSGIPLDAWLEHGTLRLSPDMRLVERDGESVDLTRSEFELLLCIMENGRRVVSKQALALAMRGDEYDTGDYVSDSDRRSVEVHLANLRRKLGDDSSKPRWIETVRGVGYRMAAPQSAPAT